MLLRFGVLITFAAAISAGKSRSEGRRIQNCSTLLRMRVMKGRHTGTTTGQVFCGLWAKLAQERGGLGGKGRERRRRLQNQKPAMSPTAQKGNESSFSFFLLFVLLAQGVEISAGFVASLADLLSVCLS